MVGLPVAATSAVSALGTTVEDHRAALFAGRSALRPAPFPVPFDTVCGAVEGPLPEPPRDLAAFDGRQARLCVAAALPLAGAVAAAVRRHGRDRVALVVGSSTGGVHETERALLEAGPGASTLPAWFDYDRTHAMNATVEVLRRVLGAGGPALVVSAACASGGKAFATAKRLVAAGHADAVVVGGVDSLCVLTLRGFGALGVLSPRPCRPFSAKREGISLGEAAALVLLDPAADAPLALLGCGETSDAHHMSAPDPEGRGAAAAMAAALADAGVDPSAVGHVNAHGTGTPQNDAAESKAVVEVLGPDVPVLSTKAWTGHTLGAAGALEAVLTLLCLEEGRIPASLGADPVDPALGCAVATTPRAVGTGAAVSNSLAFGGSNVSLVFGRIG